MASSSAAPASRPITLLATVAVVCEAVAWFWASSQSGAAAVAPVLLGLLGVAFAAAAGWLMLRVNRRGALALQRAKATAVRAVEHERAMQQAQHQAEKASELLVMALDALPIGIAIYDQHDRQVIRNECLEELFPGLFTQGDTQQTFETMLRRTLKMGLLPDVVGHEEEWIATRLGKRGSGAQPILQRYANDRWIHTYIVRTRQSFTVVAQAEVTDLVRKEHLLALANEQLSRQSATDGLTGIANRRRFDQTLASEWLRAARGGGALSLLIVDIDHFKRYNDHYGHVAGDECLRRVTRVLAGCVRRAGELLARYGGEEFVLLLPGADMAQAEEMAQRCLDAIELEALPHGSSATAGHVTFSIGLAHAFPHPAQDPESLVNAADTAMYRAKMAGRARYAVADLADWEIDKDAPRSQAAELS